METRGRGPSEPTDIDPDVAKLARKLSPRPAQVRPFRILGLGWAVVISLLLGLLGGIWLDGQLGTSPLLTLVGLALGLGGAALTTKVLIDESRRR